MYDLNLIKFLSQKINAQATRRLATTHLAAIKRMYLLYEYRDLFIDMDVRNNRSELAIVNRHQERWNSLGEKSSFTAFDGTNDVFSLVKIYRSAFWLADPNGNTCSQDSVNMESDFTSIFLTHRKERFKTIPLIKQPPKIIKTTFVASLTWNEPHGFIFSKKTKQKMVRNSILIFCLCVCFCQYHTSIIYVSLYTYLYTHIINKLLHGRFVCSIFITHSLWRIAKLTRSLRSLVRLTILHKSWIKIVRTHQPWSNLYMLYTYAAILGSSDIGKVEYERERLAGTTNKLMGQEFNKPQSILIKLPYCS